MASSHDSSLWIESRPTPNCWRSSETRTITTGGSITPTLKECLDGMIQGTAAYAETGLPQTTPTYAETRDAQDDLEQIPAYAEVDATHASLSTFQGHRAGDESPAPYATTTLVGSSRQMVGNMVSFIITSFQVNADICFTMILFYFTKRRTIF